MEFNTVVFIVFTLLALLSLKASVQIVPQSENWLVERLGKYNRTMEAGLHFLIPFFEAIQHKVPIQERQLPPKPINAITLDNVTIAISLAILYRIIDASKTMYRISNVDDAIMTIVNGTVRSVIGKTDLDGVQSNRRQLSDEIESELQSVSEEWGILLTRVEIVEVDVDIETKQAMQLQLNSERNRRALVREAEGRKEATKLEADAKLYAATKEAEAKRILAETESYVIATIAKAIDTSGTAAIDFEVKKLQANAVKELSSASNSKVIVVPTDVLSGLTSTLQKVSEKL
jgi:regulator of protease activity HflC (stomatin/prohibitin superfamily)